MDDRELDERLTDIQTKINFIIEYLTEDEKQPNIEQKGTNFTE